MNLSSSAKQATASYMRHLLPFTKTVMMSIALSEMGVVLPQAWSEKSMASISGILYYAASKC